MIKSVFRDGDVAAELKHGQTLPLGLLDHGVFRDGDVAAELKLPPNPGAQHSR